MAVGMVVTTQGTPQGMSFPGQASCCGSPAAASHLYGQRLFGFLVAVDPGHLSELPKRLLWSAPDHQPPGGFRQPPVEEAGASVGTLLSLCPLGLLGPGGRGSGRQGLQLDGTKDRTGFSLLGASGARLGGSELSPNAWPPWASLPGCQEPSHSSGASGQCTGCLGRGWPRGSHLSSDSGATSLIEWPRDAEFIFLRHI